MAVHLIAVPNGIFTLAEILQEESMIQAVHMLLIVDAPEEAKIKTFLAMYQFADTVAQLENQGHDMKTVNVQEVKYSIKYAIDQAYDSIMNTFTKQERKQIRELVKNPQAVH